MRENSVSGCLVRVREWLPTVAAGDYRSADLVAMLPGPPPSKNVFGYVLRLCGAKFWRHGGCRWVTVVHGAELAPAAKALGRPASPKPRLSVGVRLTDAQAAWVAETAGRQGNTGATIIRAAIDAARLAEGVR